MNTFLALLRLTFWTSPVQRVLTCVGAVIVVAGGIMAPPLDRPGAVWPFGFLGMFFITATGLLMGGVYWRIASAARMVRLAPHGRSRLLVGVLGLLLLVSLLWITQYWMFYLRWVDPRFYPSMFSQLAAVADLLVLASVFAVGLFIASRSPLAALLVLCALLMPHVLFTLFNVNLQQQGIRRSLLPLAAIWIPFSIWYLKARRISPPRWLSSGNHDVLATVTAGFTRPRSRREAQERLLLGGATVTRFGLQWFALLGMLLALLYAVQWSLVRMGQYVDPVPMAWAMYASLAIYPVVTTIVSFAALRRSRALWLLSASTRAEFLDCVELILRRMHIAVALAFAVWLAVLWLLIPVHVQDASDKLPVVIFQVQQLMALGWFTVYAQLARLPKWTIATAAAGLLMLIWWLTALAGTRGILVGVLLSIGMLVASILFRTLARFRWLYGDIPRLPTSAAS